MEEFIDHDELIQLFQKEYEEGLVIDSNSTKRGHPLSISENYDEVIISNKIIEETSLSKIKIHGVKFYKCKFKSIDFSNTTLWMSFLEDCIFEECEFTQSIIRKTPIYGCRFIKCKSRFYFNISETYIENTTFEICYFEGLEISGTFVSRLIFEKSSLYDGTFRANFLGRDGLSAFPKEFITDEDQALIDSDEIFDDLIYDDCKLNFVDFRVVNFIDSKFRKCEISRCSFIDCTLHSYNIDQSNNKTNWGTNYIDLNTLVNSNSIDIKVLNNMFNLNENIQGAVQELLKDKIMNSVFISYSFKDSALANAINEYLKNNKVSTFLWEENAVGGQPLKSIMRSNIDSNDRLLFIASQDSLKSKACHYELTQGREKQNQLWKTVLFPIHIDDFLFTINYEDIRPPEKRDEYWANIKDLREINSLDFKSFKGGNNTGKEEFYIAMKKLVAALKIE